MTVILQGNLQRCKLAQNLLQQRSHKMNVDVAIVSKHYMKINEEGWFFDKSNTAAIWIKNRRGFPIIEQGAGKGFVWVRSQETTIISCYLSPNDKIEEFRDKLDDIENTIRNIEGEIIIAGDFNAKSCDWGMDWTNSRGADLSDMVARTDLVVLNTGEATTFRRAGNRGTIIDVTFATPKITAQIENWRVLEVYTGSDHQYISFNVRKKLHQIKVEKRQNLGWNSSKINKAALGKALNNKEKLLKPMTSTHFTREEAEELVDKTMELITKSCDITMPKRALKTRRIPVFWWTADIASLRN